MPEPDEDNMAEDKDPQAEKYPLVSRVDKAVDKNGKVDSSDKYLSVRRQAMARSLAIHEDALHPDAHKVLKHIKPEHQAKYTPDLTKKHYTGNYADRSAVLKAAQNAGHLKEDANLEEGWDDMLKAAKERNQPQPNGGAGKKQGTAYGGSKQKYAPSPKKEELSPAQKAIDKNKNGKIDGFDLAHLRSKKKTQDGKLAEEVKVGDKVSFDHPMAAIPGKTMKKVGTVHKIEGDTVHIKVKDKYGVIAHKKSASELRKEEVELGEGIFDSLKKGYTNGLKTGLKQKIKPEHHKSYGIDDVKSASDATSILQKAKQAGHTHVKEEVESIQELSNTTLKSYTDKSTKSATDNMAKAAKHAELAAGAQKTGSIPLARINNRIADKAQAQANKRVAGMIKTVVKMKSEEVDLEEGKYSDDDWVIMQKGGTMDNPKKDTIVGYRKAGKGAFSAPKTEPGQKAMRISVAKQKGYAISVTEETAELTEAPNYALYHTTFSAAVQEAIAVAKKQGFEVDEEDWQNKVATGPKKPSKDKTNSYTIDLTKDGSPVKKKLHIQVYNMGPKYELNTYVQ
jgi:hypothetical protein